jgi:hypothetical protein
MNRRHFLGGLAGALGALSWRPSFPSLFAQPARAAFQRDPKAQPVSGVVFHDRDQSGVRKAGSPGVPNVAVSNGHDVVLTDAQGRYTLDVAEHDIIFVVKPSGWSSPLNAQKLPQFYRAHKPQGSPAFKYAGFAPTGALPASLDFALRPQNESEKFRMLLFGDPQPRNMEEIGFTMRDVLAELQGVDAAFGLTLGDVMFDKLDLYEPLNASLATLSIPWHHTLGNHDMNYDSPDDFHSDETFQKTYGPSYYAFNYAKAHFLVLNNVVWNGPGQKYSPGLDAEQLEFVRNDLKHVPQDRLVVVAMHIPPRENMEGRQELFDALANRTNVLALSAHTHVQSHEFMGAKDGWKGAKPLHHLNHATICGSWWRGAPDETGVPHATMADGAPNGYSFIDCDGAKYQVSFKAARHPAQHQMNIWAPNEVKAGESPEVVVNVFAGSPRSVVEMKLGDAPGAAWTKMELSRRPDPNYVALKQAEEAPDAPRGRKLPATADSEHIWAAALPKSAPAGTHVLQVRAKDMWGRTYTDQRLIRVV